MRLERKLWCLIGVHTVRYNPLFVSSNVSKNLIFPQSDTYSRNASLLSENLMRLKPGHSWLCVRCSATLEVGSSKLHHVKLCHCQSTSEECYLQFLLLLLVNYTLVSEKRKREETQLWAYCSTASGRVFLKLLRNTLLGISRFLYHQIFKNDYFSTIW